MRAITVLISRLGILSVALCFLPALPAALILYDGFDYPAGQVLAGQGQQNYSWGTNRWLRIGLTNETDWTIFSNSLAHPSIPSSGGHVGETNISRGASYERKFAPVSFQNGDVIWFSFLIKVTEHSLWNLFLNSAGLNANKFGVEAGSPGISIRPRLGVGYTSTENIVLGLNTTRLVVGRFRYSTALAEQLDLWVDPDTASEPLPGGPTNSNHIVHLREHNLQPAGIDSVMLEERSNGSVAFDELRVGTTWSDVVPPGTNGVVIQRITVQENQLQLALSRLVPGATTTVERASQLVALTAWEEVDNFVPSTSFTNWFQTAPGENSFYRVRRR